MHNIYTVIRDKFIVSMEVLRHPVIPKVLLSVSAVLHPLPGNLTTIHTFTHDTYDTHDSQEGQQSTCDILATTMLDLLC